VHAWPQEPQSFGSVWKLVQNAVAPEPQALGVAAGQPQVPFAQTSPGLQVWPQEPQLFASLSVVAQ